MHRSELIEAALASAWHRQTAEASFERWWQLCEKENWGEKPEKVDSLITVFGCSWYFTRFIFYRGLKSSDLIDNGVVSCFDSQELDNFLSQSLEAADVENRFEWLRSLKNQCMIQLLLEKIARPDEIEENEAALTRLAVSSLRVAMKIADLELEDPGCQIAVLGMGRIAGMEMNYGSDLDLIFLYKNRSEQFRSDYSEKIRQLLRHMSLQTATGVLYEIDMRLRPHGTSGALVTASDSFLDYHAGKREVWERQMMTRCLPIIDYHGLGKEILEKTEGNIYAYSENSQLAETIMTTRIRVEDELGTRKGKVDIKRGKGGIMDIDFLCHYLQLAHGHANPALRVSSTRKALAKLKENNLLTGVEKDLLTSSYNFFKKIEACLRLFDLKPLSTFSSQLNDASPLVRAMGYSEHGGAAGFIDAYSARCEQVRECFQEKLGV